MSLKAKINQLPIAFYSNRDQFEHSKLHTATQRALVVLGEFDAVEPSEFELQVEYRKAIDSIMTSTTRLCFPAASYCTNLVTFPASQVWVTTIMSLSRLSIIFKVIYSPARPWGVHGFSLPPSPVL